MIQGRGARPRTSTTAVKANANSRGKTHSKMAGNGTPQHAMLELKQRVIIVLNRLADRDTYQIAAEELGRIAVLLSPEEFSSFLSCIYETDSQHKTTVRKECVKVFATMATAHGELLAPHLSKILASIVRRLKDPDSNVRDACVDAAGILAMKVVHPSGNQGIENGGTFSVLVKPLCEALGEQNRYLQAGAALCLARVIENTAAPPVATLQKILPRILKLLSSQSCSANAALLAVIGSIVQVEGASTPQTLSVLVSCILGNLQNNDWATRKAAVEAFSRMAMSNAPSLSSFKSACVAALEACRFDKVKPVRDTVVQSLQVWKSVPDADAFSSDLEQGSPSKGLPVEEMDISSASASTSSKFLRKRAGAVTKSVPDYVALRNQKKRAPLADKKTNLHVSRKMEKRNTDNWHVEVAIPRTCPAPPTVSVISNEDFGADYSSELSREPSAGSKACIDGMKFDDTTRLSDQSRASCETKCIFVDNPPERLSSLDGRTPKSNLLSGLSSPYGNSSPRNSNTNEVSSSLVIKSSTESTANFTDGCKSNTADDLDFIKKHLFQIEDQQASLMELLQVFMGSSLDSIGTLEAKVQALEKIISEIAEELSICTRRKTVVEEGNEVCRASGAEILRSKIRKRNNGDTSVEALKSDQQADDYSVMHKAVQETPKKLELAASEEDWDNSRYKNPRDGCKVKPLVDAWELSFKEYENNCTNGSQGIFTDIELSQLPKALDKLAQFEKVAKSRNISLQDKTLLSRNSLSNISGKIRPVVASNYYENSHFWSVWKRAVEYLSAQDADSAYIEVLCSGDHLLLIQLMKRTGPVPESLSKGTASEVLRTVLRLLLQQKFLDTTIPWLQKVFYLICGNDPGFLGLPLEEKWEVLTALQEATTMHFSQLSSRSTIAQMASKLAQLWAGDLNLRTC